MKRLLGKLNIIFGKRYLRYLFSYVIVLLIPVMILTYFYMSRFLHKFYDEIYETVDLELVQISTQLENEYASMQNIVTQLMITDTLHHVSDADSPLKLSGAITSLSGYRMANPFIREISLVLDDQDYIITSSTTCRKDYYFNYILNIPDIDNSSYRSAFSGSGAPFCLPSQKILNLGLSASPSETAVFVFPLFSDYRKWNGSVLFFVSDSSLKQLLNQKMMSYQAQVYIQDHTGTIITAIGPNPDARLQPASEYIVRSYRSPNQWTYYAYLPNRASTFSQITGLTEEFMLAVAMILLLSGLAIFYLQRVNYGPVKQLRKKAISITPQNSSQDELSDISQALDYLSTENTTLSNRLERSLLAVKNERIYRLLSGVYHSREEFDLDCSELDLALPNDFFVVGIVLFQEPLENPDILIGEIRKQFPLSYTYYYLHNFHPGQIVLLINLPKKTIPVDGNFRKVQEILLKRHRLLTTIGIGTIAGEFSQIAESYVAAVSALEYRFVKGNGTLIRFQDLHDTVRTPLLYPTREFEALHNALLANSPENICHSIRVLAAFMEQNQLSLYQARSLCFDLVHMISEYSDPPAGLTGAETAEEIIYTLRVWGNQLKEAAEPTPEKIVIGEVMDYLKNNFSRCDFSVYETAEHFGMSLPSFSKFFKDSTGQNVIDHVIHLRIQMARELLSSTDLPLKDIAEQVGYYNVTSFIRRFKLNQGITPNQFRRLS